MNETIYLNEEEFNKVQKDVIKDMYDNEIKIVEGIIIRKQTGVYKPKEEELEQDGVSLVNSS